jgi:uncharacterized membrane protein YdbT with pleckstrin-like domain
MGYVDENLISGETVTYRGHLHWANFVMPYLLACVMEFAGGALILLTVVRTYDDSIPRRWIGVVLFLVGGIIQVVLMIRKKASEFAVTNKRVILKTGVFQRRTTEMFLTKIESVGVDQGIMARMLGYGTIRLMGTGGSSEPFTMIAKPLEFRRQVHEQIGKLNE